MSDDERGLVVVRISPDPVLAATVRAMAADLAGRADFDLDAIADLRIAVDETCSALIVLADPAAVVSCVFRLNQDHIQVRVSTHPARADARVNTSGFGWRVLETLVEQLQAEPTPGLAGHHGDGAADSDDRFAGAEVRQGNELAISWVKKSS